MHPKKAEEIIVYITAVIYHFNKFIKMRKVTTIDCPKEKYLLGLEP